MLTEVGLELGPGLNILSGETGAGKSLVVDSLALLAGARASNELIGHAGEIMSVIGVFVPSGDDWRLPLREAGVEVEADELVVRREVSREGRNRVFINDQPVTLALLARIAPQLLRIHTQREELGLLSSELQRQWLDRSGGEAAKPLLARVARAHHEYEELAGRLARVSGDERLRSERADLLRFQLREIDSAQVVAGEEDELRQERAVLRNSEAIRDSLGRSYALLYDDEGAASERLARANEAIAAISAWEPNAEAWGEILGVLALQLEEVSSGVRERLEQVEADPARLDVVETRLATLERLLKKYGSTSAEVVRYRDAIAGELEGIELDSEDRSELERRVGEAREAFARAAHDLSQARGKWASALESGVERELADLALGRARFEVTVSAAPAGEWEPSAYGIDRVEYRFAPNPGEPAAALAKIASGGELSRVFLALQLAVRGEGEAARTTLVFDEVDAGVGGAEAAALGAKLQRLAGGGGQTLVVTHLPQVASHADLHFKVTKKVEAGKTRIGVESLIGEQRIEEIARMLAGRRITGLSRSHAEELIDAATRRR